MTSARPAFRRVLVALDASRGSVAALEASARLAARLRADLVGLFVEDADLWRMAALPFTRVVGVGAGSRDLDLETLERSMRRAVAEARERLEVASAQWSVRWSFQVVRGRVGAEAAVAAERGDLVILEHGGDERALRAAIGEGRASLLFLHAAREPAPTMLVFYGALEAATAGAATGAGLAAAAHFAAATERPLIVLVPQDGALAARAEARAREDLGPLGVEVRICPVGRDLHDLAAVARRAPGAVLALALEAVPGAEQPAALAALARGVGCSVLILR